MPTIVITATGGNSLPVSAYPVKVARDTIAKPPDSSSVGMTASTAEEHHQLLPPEAEQEH